MEVVVLVQFLLEGIGWSEGDIVLHVLHGVLVRGSLVLVLLLQLLDHFCMGLDHFVPLRDLTVSFGRHLDFFSLPHVILLVYLGPRLFGLLRDGYGLFSPHALSVVLSIPLSFVFGGLRVLSGILLFLNFLSI